MDPEAKSLRNKAQQIVDKTCAEILDSQGSLVHVLVKAFRKQAIPESLARDTFEALHDLIDDARATYEAAIAQPEPKIRPERRVNLLEQ